jgi:Ca2+/Na+ antiporter
MLFKVIFLVFKLELTLSLILTLFFSKAMKFTDFNLIIPVIAVFYLVFIYILLTLAKPKKVVSTSSNEIINSSPTMEN